MIFVVALNHAEAAEWAAERQLTSREVLGLSTSEAHPRIRGRQVRPGDAVHHVPGWQHGRYAYPLLVDLVIADRRYI